jgi:hypothetical protein
MCLKLLLKYEGKWGLYIQLKAISNGFAIKLLTITERCLMNLQKAKSFHFATTEKGNKDGK